MLKFCKRCNTEKSCEDFSLNKGNKGGRASWCKKCYCELAKIRRDNNYEKIKEEKRIWYLTNKEKILEHNKLWKNAKTCWPYKSYVIYSKYAL